MGVVTSGTFGQGNAGNVVIEARDRVVIKDAININGERESSGIEFRDQLTSLSDITPSSRLGREFSGTVEINNPDVDPTQGLVELPAVIAWMLPTPLPLAVQMAYGEGRANLSSLDAVAYRPVPMSRAGHRVSEIILNERPPIPVSSTCQVVLALSSIESTVLALNSFGGISPLNNLMGRNLMAHVRDNFTVRIKRKALGLEPTNQLQVTAFHIVCKASTGGRYHIQFYASSTPGRDGEDYLYRMVTDADVLQGLLNNQAPEWVALNFRGCGETLGLLSLDKPRGSNGTSHIKPSNLVS